MRMVLIKWVDSNVTHGWAHKDEAEDNIAHCETAGIVYAEDKESITVVLAQSDCDTVLEQFSIPKSCITEMRELRVK